MEGHWASEHNDDGTLKSGAVLIESIGAANTSTDTPSRRKTIMVNLASLGDCHQECDFPYDFIGPLVDNGAPYSGIGLYEFSLLKSFLVPKWNRKSDPLRASIVDTP